MLLTMLLTLVVVTLITFCCEAAFLLTMTPNIKLGNEFQKNVSLECRYWGNDAASSIRSVSRITILKEVTSQEGALVANVNNETKWVVAPFLSPSVFVSGNASTLLDTFLRLTWPVVTFDLFEKYVCEVNGFDSANNVVTERSPEFVAAENNLTVNDILALMVIERQEERSYCDKKIAQANISSLSRVVEEVESNKREVTQLTQNISGLYHHPMLQFWPEGSYAILMPESGCPLEVAANWTKGYRRFHTESEGTNHNNVSEHSHLMKPVMQKISTDYFFFQHFCVMVDSPGHPWPNGSYCISRRGGSCPPGFSSGSIEIDGEDTNGGSRTDGSLPDGVYKTSDTTMFYCCRSDGSPDDLVELPTLRPFYLYRYNGTCQDVVGMSVTEEEMIMDSEDFSNTDKYSNAFHPDGQVNNIIIYLCYYSKV
uniref:Apextrin C-terminal domain-containing protein n=1 Tax=Biomphalaria glabrata TaxID=6526 RepID=A0A2C9K2I3_BIOGL